LKFLILIKICEKRFYIKEFNLTNDPLDINELINKTANFSIRSIEETLRSIKRIANLQNNGAVNRAIIDSVLKSQKIKISAQNDFFENLDKPLKLLNLINLIGTIPAHILSTITLYSFLHSKLPFFSNVSKPVRSFPCS
jgi:hypothetical protein